METTTYRPLDEWSLMELVYLEETLSGLFPDATVPRDADELNVRDWIDYHMSTIDRLLNEAGIKMVQSKALGLKGQEGRDLKVDTEGQRITKRVPETAS